MHFYIATFGVQLAEDIMLSFYVCDPIPVILLEYAFIPKFAHYE